VHGRAELFDLCGPAGGELLQAMLDHYLPTQGPEFGTWLDEADSVAARTAADKMFTFAAPG
jgi:hypothetical protein